MRLGSVPLLPYTIGQRKGASDGGRDSENLGGIDLSIIAESRYLGAGPPSPHIFVFTSY